MEFKSYLELSLLDTYLDRFKYLHLKGSVGKDTFAFDRYLNQAFYQSPEWKKVRRDVIIRDNGCDLGIDGYQLHGKIYIHHINPMTPEDIVNRNPMLLDPNNLICVSFNTHNAIHYGDESLLNTGPIIREPNDTCPWKKR